MSRAPKPELPVIHADPGLQPERTTLSWVRTTLALVVSSALFIRWIEYHGPITLLPFIICLVAALIIQVLQNCRHRRAVSGIVEERIESDPAVVLVLSSAVVLVGALGLGVVLL